jgi:hypothetical protein
MNTMEQKDRAGRATLALPFEQQPRESSKAFAAFSLYLGLGPQRSLEAVADKLGKSKRMMEKWSKRHAWGARVLAQSEYLAGLEREATGGLVRAKANEWLARQQKLREAEWSMHEQCIAAARRGLAAFMDREKIYANLADIARMVEVASKMGRLASGMATDKTEVTGDDGGAIKVEFALALKKVYGQPEAGHTSEPVIIDVEAVPVNPANPSRVGNH